MRRLRRLALSAIISAVVSGGSAAARPTLGEYVRAARAVEEWRFDDARRLTEELARSAPDEPETKFLVGQLAFLEGDYDRAGAVLGALAKTGAPRAKELAAELLPLVLATREATRGYAEKKFEHAVVRYPPGPDEVLVDLAGETLDAAAQRIGADLGVTPPARIRVEILARPADLARVSTLTEKEIETSGTIALAKYGKLMIVSPRATLFGYPWQDTLAHELTHYLVSLATADRVPIWLQEGLAKFEETRWRAEPGAVGLGAAPAMLLARALAKGRLVTFEEMHPSMAKLPSQEAAATAFAEVYTFVAWIHGLKGAEGLRAILARIAGGATERRAIAEVMGDTWEGVEMRWRRHLATLDLSQGARAGAGVRPGPRFRKGNSDDENLGLDEMTEAKGRRFARLGGLLRARGRLAAAAVEYEKALVAAGPGGSFVAGKLARTYLDLGEPDKAIAVARPLAERDGDDASPQATLGAAYLRLGDAVRAEPHLLAALRISPFDPAVRCGLAEVYASLGRAALAEREGAACRVLGDARR